MASKKNNITTEEEPAIKFIYSAGIARVDLTRVKPGLRKRRSNAISKPQPRTKDKALRAFQEEVCIASFKKNGLEYQAFDVPLSAIIEAIITEKEIDGHKIAELVKNPNFRFYSKISPFESTNVSTAIAQTVEGVKKDIIDNSIEPVTDFSKKGRQKRTEKADKYATEMFEKISSIKKDKKVSSFRAIAQALTEAKIETPLGGTKWQVRTLQDLEKRWKALGLTKDTPPQP